MKLHIVVPAAGSGSRFGGGMPKQYLLLDGKPVLQHTLQRLSAGFPSAMIHVVLAHDDAWFDTAIIMSSSVRALRCGGRTRAESVRNALEHLGAADHDWVVVHDAVRPCLDQKAALRLQTELRDHAVGGLLAIPVADTLKRVGDDDHVVATQPRESLWRAQTPQMFRHAVLHAALTRDGAERATDEAEAVERLGLRPRVVLGSVANIKITFPEDLALAAAMLAAQRDA